MTEERSLPVSYYDGLIELTQFAFRFDRSFLGENSIAQPDVVYYAIEK